MEEIETLKDNINTLKEDMKELREDVKDLMDLFHSARGALVFVKWCAAAVTFFFGVWVAVVEIFGHSPTTPPHH